MSLCDSCKYQYYVEQLKPCIIRRDDCEFYEPDDFHEEPKTGHWITGRSIYYDVEMYRCSECKNWSPYKAEKCPNCHVRMLGEKE